MGNAADFVEEGLNGHIVDPFIYDEVASHVISVLFNPRIEEMKSVSQEVVKKANYRDSADAFVRITAQVLEKNS